jgi:L-asparaginase
MPPFSAVYSDPLHAAVYRGPILESLHVVHAAEADPEGSVLASAGDAGLVTTLRSAAKPLQAIPALTLPGATDLGLTDEEVAICCASHPGQPRHAALTASVLALSGFLPDNLVCGAACHPPSPLRHGCSGNHAAMLLAAHLLCAPLDGYHRKDHPAQKLVLDVIRKLSGVQEPALAIDGCGVPTFGLPLAAMARAFARLTVTDAPWSRIPRAMKAHPELIGSEDWIDVRLMQVTKGRLIAKTGAEGLLCIGSEGRGMAMKVLDGSTRALGAAAVEWLLLREWISDEEAGDALLTDLRRPQYRDADGQVVAEIRMEPCA